jgi:hypothetical protein
VLKMVLVGVALLAHGAAAAASPLETYLAARDRGIAALNRPGADPNRDAPALAGLQTQLRALIGPIALPGFPSDGTITLETLIKEEGFGRLDGLAYASKDGTTKIVVTTEDLLRAWLVSHKAAAGKAVDETLPQGIDGALRAERFYTQAISPDAAVAFLGEMPVVVPAGASLAVAHLAVRRQDIARAKPDEILIGIVAGATVYIASVTPAGPFADVPACDAIWTGFQARASKALAGYNASKQTDTRLFAQSTRLEEEGDKAYRLCFASHAPEQPAFAAARRRMQGLVDSLSVK